MIFSIDEDLEKRRRRYSDWKTEGIPLARHCDRCSARHMRIKFLPDDETRYRVICELCGHHSGTGA